MEFLSISWQVLIPTIIVTLLFFLFVIGLGLKAQRRKPTTGAEGLLGETGIVVTPLDPEGRVQIHGELWFARTDTPPVEKGVHVKVTAVKDLVLTVITQK